MSTRFEWDDAKERKNRNKHKISFDTAISVFSDPFATFEQIFENGEYRWKVIGNTETNTLLLVVHKVKSENDGTEIIRIISARKADAKEKKFYEQNCSL